jgi:hypothetical protein
MMVPFRYCDYGARYATSMRRPGCVIPRLERARRYSGTTLTEISGAMPAASLIFTL